MSDEESFVILGTSPMSSLETDGVDDKNESQTSSLQSDTPGGRFTSLKNSQIKDLQNAQEIATQTSKVDLTQLKEPFIEAKSLIKSIQQNDEHLKQSEVCKSQENATQTLKSSNIQQEMAEMAPVKKVLTQSMEKSNISDISDTHYSFLKHDLNDDQATSSKSQETSDQTEQQMAASKLWSRPPQVQVEENMTPLSLEDCAVKSPLEQQQEQKSKESFKTMSNSTNTNTMQDNNKPILKNSKITPPISVESNLATSFILGEVNADVLKTSVYSQFPSISMEACAEDVLKLQNMVTEYAQLKTTIMKANHTMKLFYNDSLKWKDKMKTIDEEYKKHLDICQSEIVVLRKQNQDMESNFKAQIEALEIARKKDREETVQEISEKNALLENLRAQIIKLEQQQLASFEFVATNSGEQNNELFTKYYVPRQEHAIKIKKLERELSELLARNLDFKDLEKQYIDELNCLKVNLTAAEELIKKNNAEINQLQIADLEKQQQIKMLEKSLNDLNLISEAQMERISLLEHQNEVHRKDFEIEHENRQTAVKERQQALQDLRTLQRKNQELIEEHQKIAQSYERKLSSAGVNETHLAAIYNTFINNEPQRPIRTLPSPSASASAVPMHLCPVCNKPFKSLTILQSHVNDCIDKN